MTLEDEIAEAQEYISDPPKNESNTCDWIILPLLYAVGYARRDIESRIADGTGQFPDYTLLSSHPYATYYVEAKSWNVALEDIHVKQSLNYTNQNGKRFVVLTNGQRWRLYDNAIQGISADKLIKQAELRDTPQITDFLTMLSKSEVLNGRLEQVATEENQRRLQEADEQQEQQRRIEEMQRINDRQSEIKGLLNTTLPDLLKNSESDLIGLITDFLREETEFRDISPANISGWFEETLAQPSQAREEQVVIPSEAPTQTVSTTRSEQRGEYTRTLQDLLGKTIDGKASKPIMLQAPDGTTISLNSWVACTASVVRWLLQQSHDLPIPFGATNRNRWFLNSSKEHSCLELSQKFKEISASGKTVYMDKDRSAEMFMSDLNALCQRIQVDPSTFRITMLP